MQNDQTEIVIVSMGAMLPGADTVDQFFDNIMEGRRYTQPLTNLPDAALRQDYTVVYDRDRTVRDRSYTLMGAPLDRRKLVMLAQKLGLPLEDNFLLHVLLVEVVRQCVQDRLPADALAETDLILGLINPPSEAVSVYYDRIRRRFAKQGAGEALELELQRQQPLRRNELSILSVIAEKVRGYFRLGGLALLTDAACASSHAALYTAVLRLREGCARYAVVGGGEDGLGNVNPLIGFSQLGVLAENHPVPFDRKADGMVIGEGAAAFLLTTKAEAQRAKLPILAVIKGIGASSDGKFGGLTEPTMPGQILCYERAYGKNVPTHMTFLEAHGTGTKVGDRVELDSMTRFFAGQTTPIGSAKWSVGHTMGAAGAVGLLRALGIMQRHTLPPHPYFEAYPANKNVTLVTHTSSRPVKKTGPMNVGISSFGFGGANFHVWLQEYVEGAAVLPAPASQTHDVVLCAMAEADVKEVPNLFRQTAYRMPPKAWPFIDKMQLLGVLLTEKLLREQGIDMAALDRDSLHVFAGSTQPLELQRELIERLVTTYAQQVVDRQSPGTTETIPVNDIVEMNDQSMLGTLNSLIASRVTKAFDLRGMNMNVDADFASGLVALDVARSALRVSSGAALVFDTVKKLEQPDCNLRGVAMRCMLVASLPYALEYNLPILSTVQPLEIQRGLHVAA
ncbi:MAG: beta-ketoacyl synthase N-terminal-like domain-containing protein [Bdellovibrionales bacterium]